MGSMSSNGTKAFAKKRPQIGGAFFGTKELKQRGFVWAEVDGTLLRMTLDALIYRGFGMAFFLAQGGRGVKVKLYTDGAPRDAVVIDAAEMNGLLQWVLDDLKGQDDETQALFTEVADWLENRDR